VPGGGARGGPGARQPRVQHALGSPPRAFRYHRGRVPQAVSARRLAGAEVERVHSIFCVSRPFLDGGPQKRLFRLARAWTGRGHATTIAAMRGDLHAPVEELEELGMPVYLL